MVNPQRRFRVIVIDDEVQDRINLKGFLKRRHPDVEVVGEAGDFEEGWKLIDQGGIDGAFIDIRNQANPDGLNGLDLAYRIKQLTSPPWVVFYTAYPDDYINEILETRRSIAIGAIHKPIVNTDAGILLDHIRREFIAVNMTQDKLLGKIKNEPQFLGEKDWRFLLGTLIINGLDFKLAEKLLSFTIKEAKFFMVLLFSKPVNEPMLPTKTAAYKINMVDRTAEDYRSKICEKLEERDLVKLRDKILETFSQITGYS